MHRWSRVGIPRPARSAQMPKITNGRNLTSAPRGLLRAGINVLAIQGMNISASDRDFLVLPELTASSETFDLAARRYFMTPTPGSANGVGNTIGPLIVSAAHAPNVPKDNDDLVVTTSVTPTFKPVASVRLLYRISTANGRGKEVNIPMFDDGQHGDGAAGDGVWGR